MSRYSTRQPFTTSANYIVLRRVTINGHHYAPGDKLPNGTAPDRLMRALYDQRRIDMDLETPLEAAAAPAAPAAKAPGVKGRKGKAKAKTTTAPAAAPAPAPEAPATTEAAPAQTEAAAPKEQRHRVKQAGLGGFKVIDPSGQPVGAGWPTHAEALAEAERLDAML